MIKKNDLQSLLLAAAGSLLVLPSLPARAHDHGHDNDPTGRWPE